MFKIMMMTGGALVLCSMLLFSAPSYAKRLLYGECFSCSESKVKRVANNLALNHRDDAGLLNIHITDIKMGTVYSYQATDHDGMLSLSAIATPASIDSKMAAYQVANRNLLDKAEGLAIPASLLGSAWEFINCAYCEYNIMPYITTHLHKEAMLLGDTIGDLAQVAGLVETAVANSLSLPLAAGGKIVIKLKVDAELNLTMDIVAVIDENNNDIPATADNLTNLRIRVGDGQSVTKINSFIRDFNVYVPEGATGEAAIKAIPSSQKQAQ
ncbi:MAG: hypothetical protein ACI965_000726 [Paraglaciecola sp.]|jgi:hypothetical protein